MKHLALYCKSYRTDLKRAVRLAISIQKHNKDKIKFYISTPESDVRLFEEHLSGLDVEILSDDEILKNNSSIDLIKFKQLPGGISQQIVKSEFWRICPTPSYLCLDSDSIFIRDFTESDYVTALGFPYTVITEAHDLLNEALRNKKGKIIQNFKKEASTLQEIFARQGRNYSFGPFPLAWHKDVWSSLEKSHFKPLNTNIQDAIQLYPLESRWYGEALLKFNAIPLIPSEPFFKVYHYAWQFDQDHRKGIDNGMIAKIFSGVIYQSSWERNMDWPSESGNKLSIIARKIRRKIGQL